jgi:hypothetical protein
LISKIIPGLAHHPGLFIAVSIQLNFMVVSAGHALCAQPSRAPEILPNYGAALWCEDCYFSAYTSLPFNNTENKLLGIRKRNLALLRRFNL